MNFSVHYNDLCFDTEIEATVIPNMRGIVRWYDYPRDTVVMKSCDCDVVNNSGKALAFCYGLSGRESMTLPVPSVGCKHAWGAPATHAASRRSSTLSAPNRARVQKAMLFRTSWPGHDDLSIWNVLPRLFCLEKPWSFCQTIRFLIQITPPHTHVPFCALALFQLTDINRFIRTTTLTL